MTPEELVGLKEVVPMYGDKKDGVAVWVDASEIKIEEAR